MTTLRTVTILTFTLVAAVCSEKTGTADVPQPSLTLDRRAKVLHLECKPPLDTSQWGTIHDVKISAFLNQYSVSSNQSLVDMASNMKEPKVHDAFTVSRAHFQGHWLSKKVSLDFLFPVTSKELGRYFCTVLYYDRKDRSKTWTTEVVVDEDFVFSHADPGPKTANGLTVKVRDAHHVRVTWKVPENPDLDFKEASVSRRRLGEEVFGPSMSLFTAYGINNFASVPQVILTNFSTRDRGNFSVTLYVESDAHGSSYRYSCWVPYPACKGHSATLCSCCHPSTSPDIQECSASPRESQTFLGPFIAVLILLLLFVAVVLTMYCLFKAGRCRSNDRFQKIFKPKRESTLDSKPGSSDPIEMTTDQPGLTGGSSKGYRRVPGKEEACSDPAHRGTEEPYTGQTDEVSSTSTVAEIHNDSALAQVGVSRSGFSEDDIGPDNTTHEEQPEDGAGSGSQTPNTQHDRDLRSNSHQLKNE